MNAEEALDRKRLKGAFEDLEKEPPEGDIRPVVGQKEKMTSAALRKEIHSYIDALPDRSLSALKPILTVLTEPKPQYTIETDLTPEEIAMIDEGVAEYHQDPSRWVSLENIK